MDSQYSHNMEMDHNEDKQLGTTVRSRDLHMASGDLEQKYLNFRQLWTKKMYTRVTLGPEDFWVESGKLVQNKKRMWKKFDI